MAGYKHDRLAEDIKRELSALIGELKDPRVSGKMLSVVRIELAGDNTACKAYISCMEGLQGAKEACKGLDSAKGLIRREVGQRLHMRRTPELRFIADDSIEFGAHIARVIGDLTPPAE